MIIQTKEEFDTFVKLYQTNESYRSQFLLDALIEYWEMSGKTVIHKDESVEHITQVVHDDFTIKSDSVWNLSLLKKLEWAYSLDENHFIDASDELLKETLIKLIK